MRTHSPIWAVHFRAAGQERMGAEDFGNMRSEQKEIWVLVFDSRTRAVGNDKKTVGCIIHLLCCMAVCIRQRKHSAKRPDSKPLQEVSFSQTVKACLQSR